MSGDGDTSGVFGRAVEEWDGRLVEALEAGDHDGLRALLGELREEMGIESVTVERHQRGPHLDRLVEQARRLLETDHTELEEFEGELAGERRLWADFRRRYRQTFVPAAIHRYMESSALFLRPSEEGALFDGFDKYAGCGEGASREAVTLFVRRGVGEGTDPSTPANFFSLFEADRGRFTVQRAYRTELPRGAGRACLAEHLAWLVPEPAGLRELVWDNVQNSATYQALVDCSGGPARVRADAAGVGELPLGRCSQRLIAGLGLRVVRMRPLLDGFGFLDLVLEIEPATSGSP
jgi:hypothetical protein